MGTTRLPLDDTPGLRIFTLLATAFAPPLGGAGAAVPRPGAESAIDRAERASPGLLDRLDAWFWRIEQRAVERYLAKSQDVYELEARIRDLERMPMSRYY